MNSLWDILSVAIGISFIFMILSILNSWIQDYIATLLNLRAKNLADIMQNLLEPGAEKLNGIQKAKTSFTKTITAEGSSAPSLKEGQSPKREPEQKESADNKAASGIEETLEGFKNSNLYKSVKKQTAVMRLKLDPLEQLGQESVSISDLLNQNPVRTLYMHPVVYSLSKPKELPDFLPANDFTVALLDLLDDAGRDECGKSEPSEKITMDYIKKGIENLEKKDNPLGYRLRSLLYTAQINVKGEAEAGMEDFRNAVSKWFDDTVARGSVWYKRRMQRIGILCGFLLAIALNADTIGISNALWHNAMLREAVTQAAQTSADQGQPTGEQAQLQLEQMTNLGLPIGWSFDVDPADLRAFPSTPGGWIAKAFGLLLTGFAISQGSQIWFDIMNRLLNLRSSNSQPVSEERSAKDKGGQMG